MQVFVFMFSSSFTHDTQSTYKSKISHEILRNGCRRKNLMKGDDSCKKKKTGDIRVKKSIWDRKFFPWISDLNITSQFSQSSRLFFAGPSP
jgi:hypothetical protein